MNNRTFEIDVGSIRVETRTVSASLSSEFPVMRYDGEEVLSHYPGAVDLSRAPLPLLTAHNNAALPVGVVEGLEVSAGKLRGTLRISASQDAIWNDIQDGIIRNLSIGYQIIEKKKTKTGFIATKWQPYECSLVAAPADNTVGINRSLKKEVSKIMDKNDLLKAKKTAVEELGTLAGTGENAERLDELKTEIRSIESRIEAMDMVDSNKKAPAAVFVPETGPRSDRSLIEVVGNNRTYAGLFNGGRALSVNEDEIRAFRASMNEGSGSAGGFSVPEPLAAAWLDASMESEVIRPMATVWPMTAASLKVPGWDAADRTCGALFGGFSMEFIAENGPGTPQVGKLRAIELVARKAGIFVNISNELREDGLNFDAQLERAMKTSISYGMDHYFINGSGAGQPVGIRNDAAKIQVAAEVGQVAGTVVYENLVKMFSRMYPAGRNRAVWIANDTLIPSLLSLNIVVGTSGSFVPAMSESGNTFKIMGRPVVFTSHMPTAGSADDIVFADLSQYAIGIRRDIRLEKSNIPGWSTDSFDYRVLLRFDGMGTWNAPITPEHGLTQSWIVGLAAR